MVGSSEFASCNSSLIRSLEEKRKLIVWALVDRCVSLILSLALDPKISLELGDKKGNSMFGPRWIDVCL